MILWFFLIISWNGDVLVKHGFSSLESCANSQAQLARLLKPTVREVTDCIGVPIGPEKKRKKAVYTIH